MLRALGSPPSFLGLVAGFLLSVLVQAYAHAFAARGLGDRWAVRRLGGVRHVLDPFGAVAAALAGPGWGAVPELPLRSKSRLALALLAGPLAVAALGALALVGYVAAGGFAAALPGTGPGTVISGVHLPAAQAFCVCFGLEALGIAVLGLVPLPPLPGWRLLELASTGSPGWQRARHYLVDNNIGLVALLVLLILPLGGSRPVLVTVLDAAVGSALNVAG